MDEKPISQNSTFRYGIYLLLFFLIVLVGNQIRFLFRPLVTLISTLFLPVIIAGIFYYLTSPFVNFLGRKKFPRVAAIGILYLLVLLLLTLVVLLITPVLHYQINMLVENSPKLVREARSYFEVLGENALLQRFAPDLANVEQNLTEQLSALLKQLYNGIGRNVSAFFGFLANIMIILTTVPFILFFMLKDGEKLPSGIVRFFPEDYRDEALDILASMDDTLGSYIKGQMIVSLFVGTMVLIGYLIIGIDYALLLALVALVTNLIPYIGPILGTVPGMVVGLIDAPSTMIKVFVLVFIVQQVESQLIAPLVMGKKLKIHPLTIIFVLLTAGSLAGFFGLLLAVPGYAVGKTAVVHLYRLYRLRKSAASRAQEAERGDDS
jgi:predicted PurR-regulated permease PerM